MKTQEQLNQMSNRQIAKLICSIREAEGPIVERLSNVKGSPDYGYLLQYIPNMDVLMERTKEELIEKYETMYRSFEMLIYMSLSTIKGTQPYDTIHNIHAKYHRYIEDLQKDTTFNHTVEVSKGAILTALLDAIRKSELMNSIPFDRTKLGIMRPATPMTLYITTNGRLRLTYSHRMDEDEIRFINDEPMIMTDEAMVEHAFVNVIPMLMSEGSTLRNAINQELEYIHQAYNKFEQEVTKIHETEDEEVWSYVREGIDMIYDF